jgi:hypothetical protein
MIEERDSPFLAEFQLVTRRMDSVLSLNGLLPRATRPAALCVLGFPRELKTIRTYGRVSVGRLTRYLGRALVEAQNAEEKKQGWEETGRGRKTFRPDAEQLPRLRALPV